MHHTARGLCLSCKLHTHTCASRIICICIFLEHIICSFRIMYMWSTTSLVDINKFWLGTITVQLSHLSCYCVIIKQRGWREEGEINDILICTVFQELEFHWFKAPRWLGKGGGGQGCWGWLGSHSAQEQFDRVVIQSPTVMTPALSKHTCNAEMEYNRWPCCAYSPVQIEDYKACLVIA